MLRIRRGIELIDDGKAVIRTMVNLGLDGVNQTEIHWISEQQPVAVGSTEEEAALLEAGVSWARRSKRRSARLPTTRRVNEGRCYAGAVGVPQSKQYTSPVQPSRTLIGSGWHERSTHRISSFSVSAGGSGGSLRGR